MKYELLTGVRRAVDITLPEKIEKAKEEIPPFSATVGVRRAHNIKQHACDTQDDTIVAGVFKESNGLVGQFGL